MEYFATSYNIFLQCLVWKINSMKKRYIPTSIERWPTYVGHKSFLDFHLWCEATFTKPKTQNGWQKHGIFRG